MIVGEQKSISEIKTIIAPYKKILIMGCGTCVKTCFAGGEDEVALLASALRLACKKDGKETVNQVLDGKVTMLTKTGKQTIDKGKMMQVDPTGGKAKPLLKAPREMALVRVPEKKPLPGTRDTKPVNPVKTPGIKPVQQITPPVVAFKPEFAPKSLRGLVKQNGVDHE